VWLGCSLPAADAMADGAGSSRSAVGPFAFRGAAAGGEHSALHALQHVQLFTWAQCTATIMHLQLTTSFHHTRIPSRRRSSSSGGVVFVVVSRAHQRCTSQLPRVPPETPAECRKRRCSSSSHLLFFWCHLHRGHVLGLCCLHRKDWCWVARAVSTSRERLSKLQLSSCVCASTGGISIVDIVASIGC
jgi:hypothetical protein